MTVTEIDDQTPVLPRRPTVTHARTSYLEPLLGLRVLTKDRLENCGFCGEGVEIVVEVVVDPQRQIQHYFHGVGDHLRAATEPREKMTNVAVVLLDGDGQVFAGEELALRNEAVITLPIIGDEGLAFDANFVEQMFACGVITATKNPGDGSPSNRVIGSPKPEFLSFFYKMPHLVERDDNHFSWLIKEVCALRRGPSSEPRHH
jgi:hypothetical protein